MAVETLLSWLKEYSSIAVLVIVFLEYLNLPGFPAGVVMPLAGFWASHGGISFAAVMALSTIAGLLGSWVLYFIGRFLGAPLLEKWKRKFPRQQPMIDRALAVVQKRGYWGLFIGKLIPVLRTWIPIPAGVIRMDFARYTVFSAMGVALWNLAFVGAGYYFGQIVLPAVSGLM